MIIVEITPNLQSPDQYVLTISMKSKINIIRNIPLIKREFYKSRTQNEFLKVRNMMAKIKIFQKNLSKCWKTASPERKIKRQR